MKTVQITLFLLAIVIFFIFSCDNSEEKAESQETTQMESAKISPEVVNLPAELRTVLIKEMRQLEAGMQQLLSFLVQGQAAQAKKTATQIHESFILKQELSEAQLQQLQEQVPEDFIKLDRAFHQQAEKLAEAAGQNNFVLAMNIFGKMTSSCVTCHQNFAAQRFPGLAVQTVN